MALPDTDSPFLCMLALAFVVVQCLCCSVVVLIVHVLFSVLLFVTRVCFHLLVTCLIALRLLDSDILLLPL